MSDKHDNHALDDSELEAVSGGLYWTGSGWTNQGTVTTSSGSGTHNGIGFTSLSGSSETKTLPTYRVQIDGNHKNIIVNRGAGETLFKTVPL